MELISKEARMIVERGTWSQVSDFLMACLAYSVGLANIWRFPFIFYRNGGGAFLVPLILCIIVVSTPLIFLEFSLGQFASLGPLAIWRVAPLFKGVGISTVIVCALLSLYNAASLSLSVFYMCASWQSQLPWQTCDNAWNSEECCESVHYLENCTISINESCMLCTSVNSVTHNISNTTGDWQSPQQEYFIDNVLDLSSSWSSLGTPSWRLSLALLLVWTAVFMIIGKGVSVFSKVVYVTGLLPCLLLVVLLIRVCLADGASQGIATFLRPNWTRLTDLQVWYDAVVQAIFSVGVCYGPLITLASYNNFSRNIARLAVLVPLLVLFSALLMGVLVFAMYGALAFDMNTSVDHILKTGLSMSFTLWPQFTSSVSVPHLWATLFYLCLVLLAIDSQFISVHCICSSLADQWPVFFSKWYRQIILLLTLCIVLYLVGIVFVTQGGLYAYLILYHYLTDITPLLLGAAECILVTWVYGFSHFGSNIWTMTGKHPSFFWRVLWQGITPLFLLLAVVYSIVAQRPVMYDDIELLSGAKVTSWVLCGITFISLPTYMVYKLIHTPGSLKQRLKTLWRPSEDWGPAWESREMRKAWMTLPEYMVSEREEGVSQKSKGVDNEGYAHNGTVDTTEDNSDSTVMSGEGYMENWFPGMGYTEENIDTGSIQWSQDENKIRGNWSGRYDFLMSGLGYSIGIGNVWRFPYLVYKNGGGAFFLPYLLMLGLCGFPLFFMELAFGQFASEGQLTIWKVSPIFKGIGYAMCSTTFLICSYYNVINAWSVLYLFASMTDTLPWTSCSNDWNTQMCHQRGYRECVYLNITNISPDQNSSEFTQFVEDCSQFANQSYYNTSEAVSGTIFNSSTVLLRELDWTNFTTPSEEYFFNYVLQLSSGIDSLGTIQWHLALCLLLCWIVTFAALIRGVKSVGKVVYVTVLFPFIILLILLVRYATLEGSGYLDGIKYYVTPQWSQLGSATLWGDAASQMFFSLGLSIGGLIALGSFNRFHYDCYKDAFIIVIMDTLTSVFAGFVVFAILGVMANEAGTDVENVISAKFALAYIAFPEAVTKLPAAPLWSVLFFLMLFSLAIDSQFLMVEGLVVAITDEFKDQVLLKKRLWVILILCVLMYFLGLPMVSNGGLYILSLMDTYSASWSPVVIGFMLCVVLAWVYKVDNFAANLKVMLGKDIGRIQKFMWKFITPLVLMFILVFSLVKYEAPALDDYKYPEWAHILAILTGISSIICIPIGALVQLLRSKMHIKEAVKKGCKPHIEWGPALDKHRANCYMPGVIDLRVKEWVEQGTFGHVFQTEASGNLDILKELSDQNTERSAAMDTPVHKGQLRTITSFSSLHSEQGSVQDETERIKDMEDLEAQNRDQWTGKDNIGRQPEDSTGAQNDVLWTATDDMIRRGSADSIGDQNGGTCTTTEKIVVMRDSTDSLGAQNGDQLKTKNRVIRRGSEENLQSQNVSQVINENTLQKECISPNGQQIKNQYQEQATKIDNVKRSEESLNGATNGGFLKRRTSAIDVTEENMDKKEIMFNGRVSSADNIKEEGMTNDYKDSIVNPQERTRNGLLVMGEKDALVSVEEMEMCGPVSATLLLDGRTSEDKEDTTISNRDVKEVTFALDAHQKPVVPLVSQRDSLVDHKSTQTECSYIQDHLPK